MAPAPVYIQPSNGLTQAQLVLGGKLVKKKTLHSLRWEFINILTHPSTHKRLYQVILVVVSDGPASVFVLHEAF